MRCMTIDFDLINLVPSFPPPHFENYGEDNVNLQNIFLLIDTTLRCPFIMFCGFRTAKSDSHVLVRVRKPHISDWRLFLSGSRQLDQQFACSMRAGLISFFHFWGLYDQHFSFIRWKLKCVKIDA